MVGFISHAAIRDLVERTPQLGAALWRETLIDAAMFRDWVATFVSEGAEARLAHLICALYARLEAVGLASDRRLPLPLTQEEMGDALGMSPVAAKLDPSVSIRSSPTRRAPPSRAQKSLAGRRPSFAASFTRQPSKRPPIKTRQESCYVYRLHEAL